MATIFLKVDAGVMEALGAKSSVDFQEKLAAYMTETQTQKQSMADTTIQLTDLQKRIEALEARPDFTARIEALEKREVGMDEVKIKTIAEAAATSVTTNALAAVGTTPVKAAPVAALEPTVADLEAKGDYKAAWAADKKLQAEFDTAESYAAYAQAMVGGKIRIAN